MAINKISEFPKVTPSADDKILIEKNGEGGHINLSEMPVSSPVEDRISKEVNKLNSQINDLAFEPGDTTGDAELRNIRTPADGFTVPPGSNAGNAVRAQVTQLDGKITELKGDLEQFKINLYRGGVRDSTTNYIDKSAVTHGVYIKGQDKGQTIQFDGLNATDYIELSPNTDYYYSLVFTGYYAFYDDNKTYISGHGNDQSLTNPFRIPSGAKYVRFTIADTGLTNSWIFTSNVEPPSYKILDRTLLSDIHVSEEETDRIVAMARGGIVQNPCNYNGNEITLFNKIVCIGDSITQGVFNHNESGNTEYATFSQYSYPTYLNKLCGVETVNKGYGGMTSVEWWNYQNNVDYSGYDCAIVNLGINDIARGTTTDESRTAINNIINKLKSENNNIKIFLATIVPVYTEGTTEYDDINDMIRQYAETTDNVYLIDLTEYSHCLKSTVYEAGHLTALGYYRLAKDYMNYIGYIISNNMNDFKWVHFIGTDYSKS